MQNQGPVSLKDIARELNLSVSTVSRAIRNVGEVNPETRTRVLELAKRYQYRPNPYSMSLLGNNTHTLGVIIPHIESYLYASMLKGMNEAASLKNYRILTIFSDDSQVGDSHAVDELLHRRVDGILACPAKDTIDIRIYKKVIEFKIPLVLYYRDLDELNVSSFITDNENAIYVVTKKLIERGLHRIALIASMEPLSEGNERFNGYKRALLDYGISYRNEYIVHSTLNFSTLLEAVKNLLNYPEPPQAILCNDDNAAMTIMKFLKENNIKIPEEISIIGYNDDPYSSFLTPSISTIAQPGYLIGYKAAEQILYQVQNPKDASSYKTILQSGFIERESS